MTVVEREVATNSDLADLGDSVAAEVLESMDEALRDHNRTAPCRVTVDVNAEVVEEEDSDSSVTTEVGP